MSFRSTATLEIFQTLILKYSSKRHSYTPPVYNARNLVAAMDHNANCWSELAKRKDGSVRFVLMSVYFLPHQSWKLKWAFLIACCPSVCPYVCPSVNFSHFRLLLSKTTGPISTKFGTKHPWVEVIQICSNEGLYPSQKVGNFFFKYSGERCGPWASCFVTFEKFTI